MINFLRDYLKTAELFGEENFLDDAAPKHFSAVVKEVQSIKETEIQNPVLDRKEKLELLYQKYQDCRNCPLSKTRTKIVFGMGSLSPKVLFVGEGPGFDEDKTGLPFVGKAGKLLDKILDAIQLDRATNVYIANIVKCHPLRDPDHPESRGNDRPPMPDEVNACLPILYEQIEILQPLVICALGSPAAKTLLKTDRGISHLRGQFFDFTHPVSGRVVPLIPTYHPAALLRNDALKKDTWHDMKLLRQHLLSIQG